MDKLFEVVTPYTLEAYKKLNEFHAFNRKKGLRIASIIFSVIIIFCGISLILLNDIAIGIVYTILGILAIVFFLVSPKLIAKRVGRTDKLLDNITNTDIFYDEYFENVNEQSSGKIYYNQIYDVYESNEYFYIYINKVAVYMIYKNGFSIGTVVGLRKLLQDKIGDRYKIRIKQVKEDI